MKTLKIKVRPNGLIEAETEGIKGKACLNYVKVIEELTGGYSVDSDYTPEYDEEENLLTDLTVTEAENHVGR